MYQCKFMIAENMDGFSILKRGRTFSSFSQVFLTCRMPRGFFGSCKCLWARRIPNNSNWWRNGNTSNICGLQSCCRPNAYILECCHIMIYSLRVQILFFLSSVLCLGEASCSRKQLTSCAFIVDDLWVFLLNKQSRPHHDWSHSSFRWLSANGWSNVSRQLPGKLVTHRNDTCLSCLKIITYGTLLRIFKTDFLVFSKKIC